MWTEFKTFLLKQNALALAIGVIIGAALDKVVKAVVDDLIMPIVAVFIPGGDWQKATLAAGPIKFLVGDFLSVLLNFFIVGFVVWRIAKAFIKPPEPGTKPAMKPCQYCRMEIDPAATKCPHCTSQLAAA